MSALRSPSQVDAYLPPRSVRVELACARALLDELETVLDARDETPVRGEVVVQVADELARVAGTMRRLGMKLPGRVVGTTS